MCALGPIAYHPYLKASYYRLLGAGKMKMLAIVDVMRKLLIIINNNCNAFYLNSSFN